MTAIAATRPRGLSEHEAALRAARGERNLLPPPTGRTYGEILRENVLTFINVAVLALGVALAMLGEPSDALISIVVVAVNVVVSVAQEVRAKMVLDRIALLVRPVAHVVRDETERAVAASDLVVGDLVRVSAGDQVLADAVVADGGPLEMDESLLTGESAPVTKRPGDMLLSGTFCVSGTALAETRLVGEAALANRLTVGARAFRRVATPLQRRVDTIIRGVLIVAISFALVLVGSAVVERATLVEGVKMAMVIAGLVPYGLVLASSAAYGMSAVRVARRGVLVQQANAIDSLSHVDLLCMDKTGTLTTGEPRFAGVDAFVLGDDEVRALAGAYAASAPTPDRTLAAIASACPAAPRPVVREIAFSAARRWSALELEGDAPLVLGAPETLLPFVRGDTRQLIDVVDRRTSEGMRVLLLARSHGLGADDPGVLQVLGAVSLAEQMRADARATIERFATAGIAMTLISGDHPNTVCAIARSAGLGERRALTGDEIDRCDDAQLRQHVASGRVFARTTPQQKARILRAAREGGRYVAMVGDGINDVLALKAADLGVALRGGAPSARAVADIVLLENDVGALVPAAEEGRRILRGMRDILRIFLTRVLYAALVIAAVAVIEGAFPFTPAQNALLALLTVGIPSLALAAWAPAERIAPDDLGASLARVVVPSGWSIAVLAFATYVAVLLAGGDVAQAQSALTTSCVLAGLLFLAFVVGGTDAPLVATRADRRRTLLALVMVLAYAIVLAVPSLRVLFDLAVPTAPQLAAILAGSAVWLLALRWLLRVRALDAALGLRARS